MKERKSSLLVRGLKDGKTEFLGEVTFPLSGIGYTGVGYYCTELELMSTIKSTKDVDDVINFLRNIRPCFMLKDKE